MNTKKPVNRSNERLPALLKYDSIIAGLETNANLAEVRALREMGERLD